MNMVTADETVKMCKNSVLPKSVSITSWIQRRMSAEIVVEPDPTAPNNQVIRFSHLPATSAEFIQQQGWGGQSGGSKSSVKRKRVGPDGEVISKYAANKTRSPEEQHEHATAKWLVAKEAREQYFLNLPQDGLKPEEEQLRQALFTRLVEMGGTMRLNILSSDEGVRLAKAGCLPKEVPLTHWLQNRLCGEILLEPDPGATNNLIIKMTDDVVLTPAQQRSLQYQMQQQQHMQQPMQQRHQQQQHQYSNQAGYQSQGAGQPINEGWGFAQLSAQQAQDQVAALQAQVDAQSQAAQQAQAQASMHTAALDQLQQAVWTAQQQAQLIEAAKLSPEQIALLGGLLPLPGMPNGSAAGRQSSSSSSMPSQTQMQPNVRPNGQPFVLRVPEAGSKPPIQFQMQGNY